MICVWQGQVTRLPWPRHDPPSVDLPLELWSLHVESFLAQHVHLEFTKFVYLGDVPLWAVAGAELQVLTRDELTVQYFSELAAIDRDGERIALQVSVKSEEHSTEFDGLLIYAAQDAGEAAARIAARPLLLSPQLPSPPASPKPVTRVNPEPVHVARVDGHAPSRQPQQAIADEPVQRKKGIPDVKKAIQQTVLGALRLRGIRREDRDFKTMYHVILRATECALRNRTKEDLDVSDIHDKVEALLAIVE